MYDVHRGWSLLKDVHARSLRWTVTDTALSSDQRFLLYSSITPTVHLVKVDRAEGATQSVANITDIHEALHFG
jgi:WD repeat-containing protein 23